MEDIHKLRVFNRLKTVYRRNSVGNRKESSAEHSWSCLILADFFLSSEFFISQKSKFFDEFPELKRSFRKLVVYLEENDYFS